VRQVVTGGQTMNPSTAELLAAVEMAGADEVVILPNNKNIIPVAEQVDALTNKAVRVVPTRSMPEALAALVVYDPEGTVDANAREMVAAVGHVRTGEVTQAVRDATIDGVSVREGDWLGLADGKVVVSSLFLADAATTLLTALLDATSEIVTILTGQGSSEEATEAITGWLTDVHPGVEVELHHGGQPLYPYLFGAE
jgi:dihydroxyacetone kinase-like predicted kinase